MKILLDTHVLIGLLEGEDASRFGEFSRFLEEGRHQLVVTPILINELVAPLVDVSEPTQVFPILRRLERLRICYLDERRLVYEELRLAALAFSEGVEPPELDSVFSDRIDMALALEEAPQTQLFLRYSLAEAVWDLWQTCPELLQAARGHGASFGNAIEEIRSEGVLSDTKGWGCWVEEALNQYEVPAMITGLGSFVSWLWGRPGRCPAVRMNFEVRHQLILNRTDGGNISDICDLLITQALPYVDAAILDRRMTHYVSGARRRLPEAFCCGLYDSLPTLLASHKAEPSSGADIVERFPIDSPLTL